MAEVNNYEWLEFAIPEGWVELARKMIEECETINPTYTIEDMKEKFGSLRIFSYCQDWYDDDSDYKGRSEIQAIEDKYEALSMRTCCRCGAPATKTSTGWILPWCDKCGTNKEKYYNRFEDE